MAEYEGTARRDAALTFVVLVPVTVAAVALSAPLSPAALGAGAVSALGLELLLSRHASRVRAVWADSRVQVGAVLVGVGGGVGLAVVVGPWVLTALLAGLCTYLVVVAGSVARRRRRRRRRRPEGNH